MAIETMLNNAIQNVLQQIDSTNVIQNQLLNLNKTAYAKILQNIICDLNNHVGQLQTILKDVEPNAVEIDNGEKEAQSIINDTQQRILSTPSQSQDSTQKNNYVDMTADASTDYDDEL